MKDLCASDISNALTDLQNMSSDHAEVRDMLSNHIRACSFKEDFSLEEDMNAQRIKSQKRDITISLMPVLCK
jgi:hypothetical protein